MAYLCDKSNIAKNTVSIVCFVSIDNALHLVCELVSSDNLHAVSIVCLTWLRCLEIENRSALLTLMLMLTRDRQPTQEGRGGVPTRCPASHHPLSSVTQSMIQFHMAFIVALVPELSTLDSGGCHTDHIQGTPYQGIAHTIPYRTI